MTDTGQVPGEGLPENAGGQQQEGQPGVPASGTYPFADPADGIGGAAPAPSAQESPLAQEPLLSRILPLSRMMRTCC